MNRQELQDKIREDMHKEGEIPLSVDEVIDLLREVSAKVGYALHFEHVDIDVENRIISITGNNK